MSTILKNKIFYWIFFCTIFFQSQGQNIISGIVKDTTNNPIEFANVILTDSITGNLKAGTITDKNGLFTINTLGKCNCKLTISFIGFQPWVRNLNIDKSDDLGEIKLRHSSNKLKEVIVTSTLGVFTRKEDKIVFNVQNSSLKSGFTGVEVLGQSPSVWVDNNDNIFIRNEAARILINGRKINLSGAALASYLSDINSKNIKNIEVQTNKDASTDAESTGGIINIILIKKPLGYNGSIGSFYNFKERGYFTNLNRMSFNYGVEKWNVYGSYTFFKNTSSSKLITDISYFETENFLFTDRTSGINSNRHNYRFGFVTQLHKKHEFGIEFYGYTINKKLDNIGDLSLTNGLNIIETGTISSKDNSNISSINSVLNYTWNIGINSSLKVYVDYLKQKNRNSNNYFSTYNLGVYQGIDERNNADSQSEIVAFQTDYKKTFKNMLKLDLGVKYTTTDRSNDFLSEFLENDTYFENSDRTTSFNYRENIAATYVSIGKKYREKNYFKIGLRVENTNLTRKDLLDESLIKQNYINLFPSLYYSRDLSKNTSVSGSYSRSLRRPSFVLLNNDVVKINDFRFELGNPDLQPEYVDKFELNYLFKKQSISLYYNKTNDAINGIYFLEGDIAFYKKFNSGDQVQYGIDYNRSDKINKWWSTRFFGNLYNRKFVNEQGFDSFEKISTSLQIFNNFKLNGTTTINLTGFYTSPKADAFYEAFETYRVNLGIRKSFFNKKLSLRIDLNDVFNSLQYKNIREFDNYSTTSFTKPITRTLRFWITYNFSNKIKVSNKKNTSKNTVKNRL